jgi:uncharacterized protein with HEPN domain
MRKDDLVYIGHILEIAQKIQDRLKGKNRDDFNADEDFRIVLTHLVQIIGEAASHISQEFREKYPNIPWKAIIGMRNKVVHDYFDVDEDILWRTVTYEIKPLVKKLEKIPHEE